MKYGISKFHSMQYIDSIKLNATRAYLFAPMLKYSFGLFHIRIGWDNSFPGYFCSNELGPAAWGLLVALEILRSGEHNVAAKDENWWLNDDLGRYCACVLLTIPVELAFSVISAISM